MIVNTASYCGYTAQYEELQKLYFHSKEDLEIIAIPSNDFNDQEKGSDEDIRNFCINKYSIRFPVANKAIVKKLPGQHEVFRWLTSSEMNGWNNQEPEWNFFKIPDQCRGGAHTLFSSLRISFKQRCDRGGT